MFRMKLGSDACHTQINVDDHSITMVPPGPILVNFPIVSKK